MLKVLDTKINIWFHAISYVSILDSNLKIVKLKYVHSII